MLSSGKWQPFCLSFNVDKSQHNRIAVYGMSGFGTNFQVINTYETELASGNLIFFPCIGIADYHYDTIQYYNILRTPQE